MGVLIHRICADSRIFWIRVTLFDPQGYVIAAFRKSRSTFSSPNAAPRIGRAPDFRFSPKIARFSTKIRSTNVASPMAAPSINYRTRCRSAWPAVSLPSVFFSSSRSSSLTLFFATAWIQGRSLVHQPQPIAGHSGLQIHVFNTCRRRGQGSP
jgi:hypothetical protein